ncbi:MAG: MMPL family transporter, partial [Halobacteria archaeon]|nr:MMPL family transporter [Halobacteria archaeon]
MIDDWIIEKPGYIILIFVLLTVFFGFQLTNLSLEAGVDQFTQGTQAQETYDRVQNDFSAVFGGIQDETVLIQQGDNVVSKDGLLTMLKAQRIMVRNDQLRVSSTSSAADIVALYLDPTARDLNSKIQAVRSASPSEVRNAVRRAADETQIESYLGKNFNPTAPSVSITITSVEHTRDLSNNELASIQQKAQSMVNRLEGDIRVFGQGIVSQELKKVIRDTLTVVMPAAALLILLFMILSFRDPFDLVLGIISLIMTLVWTFGFTGLVGIPFTQMLVAVPPLLLGVGIDFSIHIVNRYREEKMDTETDELAMRITVEQMLLAFFLVVMTTVVGFGANLLSSLKPIRDFGIVASAGIVFAFLIFGIFLPAAKLLLDEKREKWGTPEFGSTPLGSEDSALGNALLYCAKLSTRAPGIFVIAVLLLTVFAGYYAQGVDTEFSREDFLPPEDIPDYLENLPEPFKLQDYTVTTNTNLLNNNFESAGQSGITMYIEGSMSRDYALESIVRAGRNPPSSFALDEKGTADSESVLTVIEAYRSVSPRFNRLVEKNDINSNGVPDDNLDQIYDALLSSNYREETLKYITPDGNRGRVVYSVKSGVPTSQIVKDAHKMADRYTLEATPTGRIMIFNTVSTMIFSSAVQSLTIAIILTAVLLVVTYTVLEGRPSLGLVNTAPVIVTIPILVATMRLLNIPFNALTATILSITIGLGVDYSV